MFATFTINLRMALIGPDEYSTFKRKKCSSKSTRVDAAEHEKSRWNKALVKSSQINLPAVSRPSKLRMHAPLCGGVRAVQGILELDDCPVPVLQDAILRRVVVHQLGQGGKLLTAIQVVEVAGVLDADVSNLVTHPDVR